MALVLTDVEGSTRLWRDAPDAMDIAMARHEELVKAATAEHGGWRPADQGEGDSTFLAFDSALDAVEAALQLQKALAAEPWPTPQPLTVRIGVHVGEVVSRDGNLLGETVSRCARLRDIGHGGQVLLSTAACELVRRRLPAGVGVRDLGEHRMKDLVHPERVWQLEHPDLPRDFPSLRSLNRGRHNLPLQLTSFFGRSEEVADLARRLLGGSRLVTITGFGGMGKTRLALAVAADLVDGTGDGVWFVDLSHVTDPALVPREIAAVLGIRDIGAGMEQAVIDHLRALSTLLVLDNLEQILDCAPFVARLLAEAGGVRLLCTSRKPLGLIGEVVYALQPFPLPESAVEDAADVHAEHSPAIALFADRAHNARRDFVVNADNLSAVTAICTRLDGVPLAIELAAARIGLLTPEALLDRLEDSLGVLNAEEVDRPERHRTVRATVAWSYALLSEPERALLARLSVFPGTAALDAVEAVCADVPTGDRSGVFPLLTSLVDKSLVRRHEQDGEVRFSLLVSVRDFAAEQLAPPSHRALADAHLAHFLQRSVIGAATGDGPDEQPWYDEMHRDAHNFRAALDRAGKSGRAEEHMLLVANLFDFWGLGGHRIEGLNHIVRARANVPAPADLSLGAFASCTEAWLSAATDPDISAPMALRSIELAEQAGDPCVLAFAHQILGFSVPDRLAAREANERAVELAQQAHRLGSPVRWGSTRPEAVEIGASLWLVAFYRWLDPQRAWALAQTLRKRAAEAGREGDVAYVDYRTGELAADVGDVSTAVALFDQAEQVFRRRRDDLYVAHSILSRARAKVRAGVEPLSTLQPLIARYREVVNSTNLAAAELQLGDALAAAGDVEGAEAAYQRAAASRWDRVQSDWRLLRLMRLAGVDTRAELDALYQRKRQDWRWKRPDLLGCLVESAVIADQQGDAEVAAELTASVVALRGDFLLPELVLADLAELERRYPSGGAGELPTTLFAE